MMNINKLFARINQYRYEKLIKQSGFFDGNWYLEKNPDVAQSTMSPQKHYLIHGGFEGRDPGPKFSSSFYFNRHEEVKQMGLNPLIHYILIGRSKNFDIQPSQQKNGCGSKEGSLQGDIKKPIIPNLIIEKLEIIDYAFISFKLNSFADLGGVWGVDGGYTFYTIDKYNVKKAVLIDTHPTPNTLAQGENHPQLRIIQGNFGDERILRKVGDVDAIFLFDVLLHQVAPNWDRILEMYASLACCFVVYNQQWTGSDHTIRLLDLGEKEYFDNVPHNRLDKPYNCLFQKLDQKHPDHDRPWRDVHHIWQWGITDNDLISKIESLGFSLQFFKNCGRCGDLKNFENHAFVFKK